MKVIMFVWLCIYDPWLEISKTCQDTVMKGYFTTMEQCQATAALMYKDIEEMGNVYMTSFCTQKQ